MGTEVQFKMFFPGYHFTNDVNDKAGNRGLLLGYDNSTIVNGFSRPSTSNTQLGPQKEELRQMILKQESIFRHQLHELHRLYKIQRNLMNEIGRKDSSNYSALKCISLTNVFSSSDKIKQIVQNFPLGFPNNGKNPTSEVRVASESKGGGVTLVRQLFDLELQADEYITEKQKLLLGKHAELSASTSSSVLDWSKEALHKRDDLYRSSRASFHEQGALDNLKNDNPRSGGSSLSGQVLPVQFSTKPLGSTKFELEKTLEPVALSYDHRTSERQTSKKIFGVEICQRNHRGSELSLQPQTIVGQVSNASTGSNMSFVESMQSPLIFQPGLLVGGPREGGSSYQMSTESLLINFHQFVGMKSMKFGTNDSERSVKANGCSGNGKVLEPLKDKSHVSGGVGSIISDQMINIAATKSAGTGMKRRIELEQSSEKNWDAGGLSRREFLDLNVCPSEEEASSTFYSKTSDFKPMRGDIDLEAPAQESNESESTGSKQGSSVIMDATSGEKGDDGVLRVAAETLITISSTAPPATDEIQPDDTWSEILRWFAEITVSSFSADHDGGDYAPEGMDYFEFATLNLAASEVEQLTYKPPVSEELHEKVLALGRPPKAHARRGRQKKDFQRDVLPGLTSLSRYEVTEDLHTIEGLIKARTGASRTTGMPPPQRSDAGKGSKARRGKGNRRNCTTDNDRMNSSPPQTAQKPQCRELGAEAGALMGWGKRARRPKRPRYSRAIPTIPLKEVC